MGELTSGVREVFPVLEKRGWMDPPPRGGGREKGKIETRGRRKRIGLDGRFEHL